MKKPALPISLRNCLIIGVWLLIIPISPAHAQVGIVVSPPTHNLEVKPGDILQKTVKITNPSEDKSLNLKTIVSDFIVQDDQGTPVKVSSTSAGRYLASPWFSLDQSQLTLAPRETAVVNAVITVPQDALPGGHYAAIFFEPVIEVNKKDSATYTSAQVGSLFELTIAGDLKYDALIKEFAADRTLYEFGPINFSAILENQSDSHISPTGVITIKDMLGRKVGELTLDKYNIFPFVSRSYQAKWDNVWGLGKYSAELTFTYQKGLVASRVIEFWILPYRLLAAVCVILLALIAILISVRRHLKHKADNRDQEIDELKRKISELENKR